MILILGGTTEGRIAAKVVDEAGKPFYYSTRGDVQKVETKNGIRVSGGLDVSQMSAFCSTNEVRLIVDAAHPFASLLHHAVTDVATSLSIPVVRYERIYPERSSDVVWCDDYADACERMEQDGVKKLLALTGVKTIGHLKTYWNTHECVFRVLDRDESVSIALDEGFPKDNLVFYTGGDDVEGLILSSGADAVLTKESGLSGGFAEKLCAARKTGARLYAVRRPDLNFMHVSACVNGPHGLRRQIERYVPGFYPLRTGFTTGACATAAAKAALMSLQGSCEVEEVGFNLPNGETMSMPISRCEWTSEWGRASVVKDAGDDPDVTDGIEIEAVVRYSDVPGIRFLQGEGVGVVTLPGLGLDVGEPAINPVPRKMIRNELSRLFGGGLEVTINVPGGRDVALRTFNSKVGVVGGISILGTSGIVSPFSRDSYLESIAREIDVCIAVGSDVLVLNSGAKSERAVKEVFPDLCPQSFVHYGNFIGESLSLAHAKGIMDVRLGIMIGKAVKLAEGHLNTHSHRVELDKDFICLLAADSGCSPDVVGAVSDIDMARNLWGLMSDSSDADKFFTYLLKSCLHHCRTVYPKGSLTVMLVDETNTVRYSVKG